MPQALLQSSPPDLSTDHNDLDAERSCAADFVEALTKNGWLAASATSGLIDVGRHGI